MVVWVSPPGFVRGRRIIRDSFIIAARKGRYLCYNGGHRKEMIENEIPNQVARNLLDIERLSAIGSTLPTADST